MSLVFVDKGCSSSFWKRMEPLFCVTVEDKSFLEDQVNLLSVLNNFSYRFAYNSLFGIEDVLCLGWYTCIS